jgi:hypothetical protein
MESCLDGMTNTRNLRASLIERRLRTSGIGTKRREESHLRRSRARHSKETKQLSVYVFNTRFETVSDFYQRRHIFPIQYD